MVITCCMDWWRHTVLHQLDGLAFHVDVITWKHFPRYWPIVRGIHRSPASPPHKGQWCGALMFPLICALNKRSSKQSRSWWFEMPSRWNAFRNTGPLWGKPRSLVDLPRKGPVMWSIHIFSVVSLYMWLIEDNMTLKGRYCNEIFALAFAYRIVPDKTKNDINDNSGDDDDDNNHNNFNVYISFKYSDSYFPFTFWRLLKDYHWNSGSEALFLHPGPWRGIFPASHVVTMRYIATSLIRRNCTGVLVLVACLHLTVNRGIWWYDATDG